MVVDVLLVKLIEFSPPLDSQMESCPFMLLGFGPIEASKADTICTSSEVLVEYFSR
jgi:hypothetical protein